MVGNTFKSEGVILKSQNLGEADRIFTFYTINHGKIVCLAKGVRKINSRKRGSLQIFNRVTFLAIKGKSLPLITETQLLNTYSSWRKSLKKVATAYQIAEMVDKMTAEGSEQEDVFELLVNYLENLSKISSENLSQYINYFGQNLLKLLGFWPKNKSFPLGFDSRDYIEGIIDKKLKSSGFLKKVLVEKE